MGSLAMHPLGILLVAQAFAVAIFLLKSRDDLANEAFARVMPRLAMANLVLAVSIWVVRAATQTLPPI